MAFTEAEATGRSTQMNLPRGSQRRDTQVSFQERSDRPRDERSAGGTVPRTIVNLQEEITERQRVTFPVSADKVSFDIDKNMSELEGVIAPWKTERLSRGDNASRSSIKGVAAEDPLRTRRGATDGI